MYRHDLINAAMGARRISGNRLAALSGLAPGTISAIRNGKPMVIMPNLKAVADALEIPMSELFTPKPTTELVAVETAHPRHGRPKRVPN